MATIVIYDSGVGGLSIYAEVIKRCADFRYVFVSDNEAFPYGKKGESELIERVLRVTKNIEQHYSPDLLIVACNSASTVALPRLRETFAFPIIGVVPAIKPAAAESQTKCIGLLATPGTISRSYTDSLIEQHAKQCKVLKLGSSELVEMAEAKLRGSQIETDQIEPIIQALVDEPDLDTVVLACTHFPLLKDEIAAVLGDDVQLIDSGSAVARRVAELSDNFAPSTEASIAVFTQTNSDAHLAKKLKQIGFDQIRSLTIK